MTIQILDYTSQSRLSCSSCTPSDVILCVQQNLVAKQLICANGGAETYQRGYIAAQLVNSIRLQDACRGTFYKYVFTYDDAQLIPGALLSCQNINGVFCKGCLTTWVEDIVGNEPTLVDNEDGTLTFTSPHGCVTTFSAIASCTEVLACIHTDNTISGTGTVEDPFSVASSVATLTDNEDRTFTFDNGIDPTTTFYQGIGSITSTGASCQGVGTAYALKAVSLSGGILNIRGAAEHTSFGDTAAGSALNVGAIPAATLTHVTTTTTLVLANTSSCRSASMISQIQGNLELGIASGATATYGFEVSVDGGAFSTYSAANQVNSAADPQRYALNIVESFGQYVAAAGDSQTLAFRMYVISDDVVTNYGAVHRQSFFGSTM